MNPIEEAYEIIDDLFEGNEINSSTYQCCADVINDCDPEMQGLGDARENLQTLLAMNRVNLRERRKEDKS